jgi:hypothetical protein
LIFSRLLRLIAAVAAIAAAASVCVVALSYALYAAVRDLVGPAWAGAIVAGAAALVVLLLAWVLTRKAKPAQPVKGDTQNLTGRLIDLARERPLVALGAVAAAATVVVRNPRILSAVVAAAFASRPPSRKP